MNVLNAGAVITAGLLDSFNPCAVGVMLMFVALLFSLYRERRLILLFGTSYIVGIFITYLFIGLGILKAVHLFGIHGLFGYASAILLIVFGLFHLNISFLQRFSIVRWFNSCHVPKNARRRVEHGTVAAAIVLGILVGICEFPCSGGVYLATVGLLANIATFWQGVVWLILYNLIFILPLVIIFLIAGNQLMLDKLAAWHQRSATKAKAVMGWLMIILGILLLTWLVI